MYLHAAWIRCDGHNGTCDIAMLLSTSVYCICTESNVRIQCQAGTQFCGCIRSLITEPQVSIVSMHNWMERRMCIVLDIYMVARKGCPIKELLELKNYLE